MRISIDPRSEIFHAKIFVLGRRSNKDNLKIAKISEAVDNKNHNAFKKERVKKLKLKVSVKLIFTNQTVIFYPSKTSQFERLNNDFCFEKTFIDFTNVERTFRIELLENNGKNS